jgi:hypothetical protein
MFAAPRAAAGYSLSSALSGNRTDMRDEIRRVTHILESGHLDIIHAPNHARSTRQK